MPRQIYNYVEAAKGWIDGLRYFCLQELLIEMNKSENKKIVY